MSATGVYVKVFRNKLADLASNTLGTPAARMLFHHFKIGEGGYQLSGGIKVPKVPGELSTELESVSFGAEFGVGTCPADSSAYGGWLRRDFSPGDVTDDGAGTVEVTILLEATEPLLDDDKSLLSANCGNPPELFELGIYDEDDVLITYCTFDEVVKTSGKQIQFTIIVTY